MLAEMDWQTFPLLAATGVLAVSLSVGVGGLWVVQYYGPRWVVMVKILQILLLVGIVALIGRFIDWALAALFVVCLVTFVIGVVLGKRRQLHGQTDNVGLPMLQPKNATGSHTVAAPLPAQTLDLPGTAVTAAPFALIVPDTVSTDVPNKSERSALASSESEAVIATATYTGDIEVANVNAAVLSDSSSTQLSAPPLLSGQIEPSFDDEIEPTKQAVAVEARQERNAVSDDTLQHSLLPVNVPLRPLTLPFKRLADRPRLGSVTVKTLRSSRPSI